MIAILHGDVSGSDVGNHFGDEERIVFGAFLLIEGIITGFFFKSVETTDTCSNDNTDAVAVEAFNGFKSAIFHSLTGCNESILRIEVELTELATVGYIIGRIEILNLA